MSTATIAHTTDRSGDDRPAFLHAAALAAAGGSRLVTVHGNAPPDVAAALPDATPLAQAWGHPIVHERRCHECCDDVTDTVLDALAAIAPALVVTGTHARHGVSAWVRGSIGWALARNLMVPTLVVPNHGRGFVDERTGALTLARVVAVIDGRTASGDAAAVAHAIAVLGAGPPVAATIVAVEGPAAALAWPGATSVATTAHDVEATLKRVFAEVQPTLVVLPHRLHGGHGPLLGSRAESVSHHAGCPVLVVPIVES
ncbi:MAG: universal stress protein [Myxococcales bacterium]|nr:universal stress protein [Myxococcales bacterium]MBK7194480.1 universal stress protein [Myxococcales bacterium]MBP6846900.1 universal stress protein [Kofleriaceae bacterium]